MATFEGRNTKLQISDGVGGWTDIRDIAPEQIRKDIDDFVALVQGFDITPTQWWIGSMLAAMLQKHGMWDDRTMRVATTERIPGLVGSRGTVILIDDPLNDGGDRRFMAIDLARLDESHAFKIEQPRKYYHEAAAKVATAQFRPRQDRPWFRKEKWNRK